MLLSINTKTTGKYTTRKINGRDHIVTEMMPIRGDISMNGIFYPLNEIKKSYMQLNNMIAPADHPRINGEKSSAYHPCAINAHNVGGYVSNPRMSGKKVVCDFMLDVETAETTENGKSIIAKIKSGSKVGVSTGLFINSYQNKEGKDDFGKEYNQVGAGFNFDHVAILMNEEAAGAHAGTELMLNEELNKRVLVIEYNAVTTSAVREALRDLIDGWIMDFYLDESKFIYEDRATENTFEQSYKLENGQPVLEGARVQVYRKVSYEVKTNENEGTPMDKTKLIMALVANGFKGPSLQELESMDESALAAILVKPITANEAKKVLEDDGIDFAGLKEYQENQEGFKKYLADQAKAKDDIIKGIMENSEYTSELLKDKSLEELNVIANLAKPKLDTSKRIPQGGAPVGNSELPQVSFEL